MVKTKSFKEYIDKRLSKKEIAEIEKEAELDIRKMEADYKELNEKYKDFWKEDVSGVAEA